MLVKSQHLESKGKKVKSSRSSLAITGSSRSAWSTPCFKTGSNLSNKETLQGLNHPEHSAPLLTHRDRSGSCVLLAGAGRAAVLFCLKIVLGPRDRICCPLWPLGLSGHLLYLGGQPSCSCFNHKQRLQG